MDDRKIAQVVCFDNVAVNPANTIVLASDGTLWRLRNWQYWEPIDLPPLPATDEP